MSHDANELRSGPLKDEQTLSDLKAERAGARTKAKEAQRIEQDANDAARQSRNAYRLERQAQRASMQADKQAKKAARARTKSDKN